MIEGRSKDKRNWEKNFGVDEKDMKKKRVKTIDKENIESKTWRREIEKNEKDKETKIIEKQYSKEDSWMEKWWSN